LATVAKEVTSFDDENIRRSWHRLFGEMLVVMKMAGGIGLAAPQVGIPLRAILMEVSEETSPSGLLRMLNPVITGIEGPSIKGAEGCLSLLGQTYTVARKHLVHVRFHTLFGALDSVILSGMEAVCLQHEIDHLEGILINGATPVDKNILGD
jgi:peptide deformylase